MSEDEAQMRERHDREQKELQDKTKLMLEQVKGDKKKTAQVKKEIEKLEDELTEAQQQEMIEYKLEKMNSQEDEEPKQTKSTKQSEDEKKAKKKEQNKKKVDKKKQKVEKQKQEAIQDLVNSGGSDRDKELDQIKISLNPLGLYIKVIDSDGHCLYRAVADQLSDLNIENIDYKEVRKRVATYLRAHKDDYINFLETPSGDLMTDQGYEKYCDRVESSSDWGGQVEIMALTNILKQPIKVFTSGQPINMGEDHKDKPTIQLSYHKHFYALGEHYNSVVKVRKT
ncbi:deubiquitinase [Acrasis kona]|uniref:Deubiquitinase n=1 Tax=Acrasis kona TaxID=1008807 RepID=A0AAW2Z7J8_9EUKA